MLDHLKRNGLATVPVRWMWAALVTVLMLAAAACGDSVGDVGGRRSGGLQPITDAARLQAVMSGSDHRLAMIEFYADWCSPCQTLKPVLERLAADQGSRLAAYKVDVDQLRPVLARLGIRGIPHVMFFKNGALIQTVTGLHPESTYLRIIRTHI